MRLSFLPFAGPRAAGAFSGARSSIRSIRNLPGAILSALLLCGLCASTPLLRAGEAPGEQPAGGENADPFEGQIVQEIQFRGLSRVDEGTVLRLIRTRKGRPFSRKVWDEDFRRLIDAPYFINVRTTEPIPWPGGVRLDVDLVEKATIAKIEFKGNTSISRAKLLGIIKSYEGGRYDKGQVHEDKMLIERNYHERAFRGIHVDYNIETLASHRQEIGGKEIEIEDEVRIVFTIDEGSPVGVRKIRFEGNKAFSTAALLAVMGTKHRRLFRAGDLKDEELELDKKRLDAFYRRAGYMDVEIERVDVNLSKETYFNWFKKRKRLAEIVIKINEGPRYYVGEVKIQGNTSIERDEIEAVMKLKPGAVFSDLLMADDHDRIVDLYGERGRVFTKVAYGSKLVTDPERTAKTPNLYDVEFRIDEGAEVTLREVITRGNTKTRDKVIIRQMELFPGDRIDTTKVRIAVARLKNLDYFGPDVSIKPEPTENPEEANLIIDVTEKNTGEFNFGAGFSSVDSFVGNIKLRQRNFDFRDLPKSWRDLIGGNAFVGAGQDFSIEATGGAKRQNYSASFYEPWAFDRPIRLGGSIFHTVDNNYKDFNQSNTGFTATAGRRLWGPRWDGEITYRFSYTQIGEIANRFPPILQDQEGSRILSSLKPRLVYDSRDNRLLPSRGFLAEASIEFGGGPLLGDYTWVRPQLDLARYLTMYKLKNGQKHILELHARMAAIEAYGDSDDVPPFMRFYAGGIDTIRGFEYRTITPLENGYQIGGKKLFIASAEYSLPLYEEIVRGSVFIDGGEVWDAGNTDPRTTVSNESGFRASVGLGLSIRTPLSPLPIRIYIARPLSRNDQDRTKTLDFTFGTRF